MTRLPVLRRVVHLGMGACAFWLAWALIDLPAAADNCSVFTDCFNQANAAAEAAFGLTLLTGLSLILDFIPIVGDAKGIIEGISGRDLLTGEKLSDWERSLGMIPLIPFTDLLRAGRHFDDLAGLAKGGDDFSTGVTRTGRPDLPGGPGWPRTGDTVTHPPATRTRLDQLVDDYADATPAQRRAISEEVGELGAMSYLGATVGRDVPMIRSTSSADVAGFREMVASSQPWPGAVTFRGRNVTNIVYFDGKTLHIIEAKGGNGVYGDRLSNLGPGRISQTDPNYPLDVAIDMSRSGQTDGRSVIGRIIRGAYRTNSVRYVGVRTGPRSGLLAGNPATVIEHVILEP